MKRFSTSYLCLNLRLKEVGVPAYDCFFKIILQHLREGKIYVAFKESETRRFQGFFINPKSKIKLSTLAKRVPLKSPIELKAI